MRIKEYEYIRDLMKKLIYSLEQVQVTSLDKAAAHPTAMSKFTNDEHLPRLKAPSAQQHTHGDVDEKSVVSDPNKSMELRIIKRLHFLRNSLESHNPRETTVRLRQNAARKRDERILELWRKDQ